MTARRVDPVSEPVDGGRCAIQPEAMTAAPIPLHGRWVWDLRGDGRAVRVSAHADEGMLNVSLWRSDRCVGTARLAPADVGSLVAALTDGLAEIADRAASDAGRLHEIELRLARVEHGLRGPAAERGAVPAVVRWARAAVGAARQHSPR